MKKIKRYFSVLCLLAVLVCGVVFPSGITTDLARAEDGVKTFSVDYTQTGLVEGEYYSYSHVAADANGNVSYGVVPAVAWGSMMEYGDGEIVYKIQGEGDTLLKDVKLHFNAYFGCAGLGAYWGANNTNIRVKVSKDANSYIEVMNTHDANASSTPFVTNVVTNPNGESLNGSPITVGQEGVYGNHSVYADWHIDLDASGAVGMASVLYIKLEFSHLTYDELNKAAANTVANLINSGHANGADKTLIINRSGIRLMSVGIEYTEEPISDEGKTVYSEDVSIDFNDAEKDYHDLTKYAYDVAGLTVMGDDAGEAKVDYCLNGETGQSVTALAPTVKNGEGYMLFKFKAPEGQSFQSLTVTTLARLFDYNMQGIYEKVDLYVGYTMSEYTLVYSNAIENYKAPSASYPNGNCPVVPVDFDKYVYGRDMFYVKLVVGCSNDRTWTNLKEISFDVEYESIAVDVMCGDVVCKTVTVRRGENFVAGEITLPESFVRSDDKIYLTADCTQELDLLSPLQDAVTKVYLKGEWGYYTISYELDGGTNSENNVDRYVSAEGVQLYAPSKEGYRFVGWYTDEERTAPILQIDSGRTGNVTLYAKYVPDVYVDLGLEYVPESGCDSALGGVAGTLVGIFLAAIVFVGYRKKRI